MYIQLGLIHFTDSDEHTVFVVLLPPVLFIPEFAGGTVAIRLAKLLRRLVERHQRGRILENVEQDSTPFLLSAHLCSHSPDGLLGLLGKGGGLLVERLAARVLGQCAAEFVQQFHD